MKSYTQQPFYKGGVNPESNVIFGAWLQMKKPSEHEYGIHQCVIVNLD